MKMSRNPSCSSLALRSFPVAIRICGESPPNAFAIKSLASKVQAGERPDPIFDRPERREYRVSVVLVTIKTCGGLVDKRVQIVKADSDSLGFHGGNRSGFQRDHFVIQPFPANAHVTERIPIVTYEGSGYVPLLNLRHAFRRHCLIYQFEEIVHLKPAGTDMLQVTVLLIATPGPNVLVAKGARPYLFH